MVAFSVVIAEVPPRLSTPETPLVKVLVPARFVATVRVPLFVVLPLIVKFGMAITFIPLMVFVVPLKVWMPVLAVKLPLFTRLPP